jgi:hypothetical protein
MAELTPENRIVDIPGLNGFQIGEHVVVDASADNDRFEGVIIGIELRRLYGSNRLVPSITLLHDSYITDEFKPSDCRKVSPSPAPNVAGQPRCGVVGWPPVKKAIWDQVIAVNLNGKEYISAWNLTDRIYASVCEALSTTEGKDND